MRHERRDEMRLDNLEAAHGLATGIEPCPDCGQPMADWIAGTGVCRRCHLAGLAHLEQHGPTDAELPDWVRKE